jgi:pimeloyl-ACP methyl ester carboxylesterase
MDRRDAMKLLAAGIGVAVGGAAMGAAPAPEQLEGTLPWTSEGENLHIAVFRRPGRGAAVLYVHGATFPTSMSVAWRMDGVSWFDHLQAEGFDAWSFDFVGYGKSARPSVFDGASDAAKPYGRAPEAADQIIAVLEHIRQHRPGAPIHLIAHSWGTLPAQLAAIQRPDLVSRLVLFGPVVRRSATTHDGTPVAWDLVSSDVQRPRQRTGLPESQPTLVPQEEIERWCRAYLQTDPLSAIRTPHAVKVPGGPMTDVEEVWSGAILVDSGAIRQPTLIVRGEWDHVTTDMDARALFDAIGTDDKRDLKISGGNHWLHLQPRRTALWQASSQFLLED